MMVMAVVKNKCNYLFMRLSIYVPAPAKEVNVFGKMQLLLAINFRCSLRLFCNLIAEFKTIDAKYEL